MTEKRKSYEGVKIPYQIISDGIKIFHRLLTPKNKKELRKSWEVKYSHESWKIDSEEQFRAEYNKDEIVAASIYYFATGSSLVVQYYKVNTIVATSISVSLSTIEKVEKVFSVFDAYYEEIQKQIRETEKLAKAEEKNLEVNKPELETPLPEYKLEAILPSTLVDIRTIANLEKYIKQRVSQLVTDKETTASDFDFLRPTYKVTISDSQGTLDMSSISLFSKDMFDNDTYSVTLKYGKLLGSNTFEIKVAFAPERISSKLKLSYKGENARDIVESIRIGIFNILNESKTNHSFYHSLWTQIMLNIFITVGLFLSLGSLSKGSEYLLIIPSAFLFSFLFIFIVPKLKPYTVFDSKKSRSVIGWNKWLIEAILAALLAWVLFTIIPKILQLP